MDKIVQRSCIEAWVETHKRCAQATALDTTRWTGLEGHRKIPSLPSLKLFRNSPVSAQVRNQPIATGHLQRVAHVKDLVGRWLVPRRVQLKCSLSPEHRRDTSLKLTLPTRLERSVLTWYLRTALIDGSVVPYWVMPLSIPSIPEDCSGQGSRLNLYPGKEQTHPQ